MSKRPFDTSYFASRYGRRVWRAAGNKPVLDTSRLRFLRRWVSGGRMLEVGAGHGSFCRRASSHFDVLAVDLDLSVVANAVAGSAVHGIVASATALPVKDHSIDLITCIDVIEHLPEPERFLEEAHRVLRPGGVLHLSTPNPDSFGARRKGPSSHVHQDPTHCSVHSIATWREKLDDVGFDELSSGTDGLWDVPYFANLPRFLQWTVFVGATQLAWMLAPAFPWRHGENFVWTGRRRE